MPRPTIPPLAVNETEAAHRLGVSVRTIRNLRASGDLPSFTIGRSRRYLLADVDALAQGTAA